MGFRDRKRAILAMSLGTLVLLQGQARADDTAEEIKLLKSKLKQLEEKVNAQARREKETQGEIRRVAARPAPAPVAAAGVPGIAIAPLGGAGPQSTAEAQQAAIRGLQVAGSPSLYINGVSITPGGFLALEGVYRSRFIGADIGTPYQNIPFANVRSGLGNEFRMTARQSRASLLVQGDVNPATHLAGYAELDFLGAAQTANSNESNSYNLRIRHLYATVDQDDFGAHLLAGQNWSLVTMNTTGILPRKENIPLSIDAQYVPGFAWSRQPQIRVVKDFDKTFWMALSVENPATTVGCVSATSPFTTGCSQPGPWVAGLPTAGATAAFPPSLVYNVPGAVGGSLFNSANPITLNHMPDVIGKMAWDTEFVDHKVHVEGFGMFRDFYNNVFNTNQDSAGWGAGGSILVSLVPKTLDFQFSGMTGRGIGRYGTSQLPDVTFNWNGTITPLRESMLLAGLTWHALPGLDVYAYAGEEYEDPSYSKIVSAAGTTAAFGYGNPLYSNFGCNFVPPATTATVPYCAGNTSMVRQLTAGFWDKLYDGPFGSLRTGVQYSYTEKFAFAGAGGGAKTTENMVLGSIRYYPFQ